MTLIVMLLLVSLGTYSERASGLLVGIFMSMVEWDVDIFRDCTTWTGMIPGHTANQALRCKWLRLSGRNL
jgi:hypothetical protein